MTKLLIPVVLLCWCLFQSSPWNKHLSIFSICRKDFSPPGNAEMALWGWKTTLKNDAVWLFSSYWSGRDLVSTGKDGATKPKSQRTTCCVSWSERSCFAQKVHVLERTKPRATVRKLLLLHSKIKQEFTWQSPFHTQVCCKERSRLSWGSKSESSCPFLWKLYGESKKQERERNGPLWFGYSKTPAFTALQN